MSLADVQFESQDLMPWTEDGFTYTSVLNLGNSTETVDRVCHYPGQIASAAPSNLVYTQCDSKITIGFSRITVTPKPRDTIEPPGLGRALVVLSVQRFPLMQYWDLMCRDLVLAYNLRDSATIKRSTPTPDAAGFRDRNVSTVASNVPCRLQPVERSTEFDDRRVNEITRYTCFLGQALTLDAGDTIEVDSVQYEVVDQSDIDQADTLTSVTCERRR